MRRLVWLLLALPVAGLLLAGCADEEQLEVNAIFDDVVDLTTRAHVKIADVPVGLVRSIELTDDLRARVRMTLDAGIELPSEVTATLRKTNVLGERFVELVPVRGSGGRFVSGDTITDTRVLPELEELVDVGSDLLATVAADRIAGALEAGAVGLEGRGGTLNTLLDDFAVIVETYDRNSTDLLRLVDGLEAFLADVGPEADLHGRAFSELARSAAVLREEDERLLDTLSDVRALSLTGTDILVTHRARMDRFFQQFPDVLAQVADRQDDLASLLATLQMHNHNTIRGVNAEHAQVILDFMVCGINDDPGHHLRACDDPPQARERPVPREPVGDYREHLR